MQVQQELEIATGKVPSFELMQQFVLYYTMHRNEDEIELMSQPSEQQAEHDDDDDHDIEQQQPEENNENKTEEQEQMEKQQYYNRLMHTPPQIEQFKTRWDYNFQDEEVDHRDVGWQRHSNHNRQQQIFFNHGIEPGPINTRDKHGNRIHNTVYRRTQITQVAVPVQGSTPKKNFAPYEDLQRRIADLYKIQDEAAAGPREIASVSSSSSSGAAPASASTASNQSRPSIPNQDVPRN